jgi:hypothetical protein
LAAAPDNVAAKSFFRFLPSWFNFFAALVATYPLQVYAFSFVNDY